jgi:ribosomal protein S14
MRFGKDPEDTHENMHMYRRERKFNGHKLARAVGLSRTKFRNAATPLNSDNARLRKSKG